MRDRFLPLSGTSLLVGPRPRAPQGEEGREQARRIKAAASCRTPKRLRHPRRLPRQLTVKVPVLVAVPPGVVTPILPVFAPVGTVAVIVV